LPLGRWSTDRFPYVILLIFWQKATLN